MTEPTDHIAYNAKGDATAFVGRRAVNVFACAAVASALRLYAKTGMKVNRAYTPTAMLAFANRELERTGKNVLKRGQYLEAADALSAFIQAEKAAIPAVENNSGMTVVPLRK